MGLALFRQIQSRLCQPDTQIGSIDKTIHRHPFRALGACRRCMNELLADEIVVERERAGWLEWIRMQERSCQRGDALLPIDYPPSIRNRHNFRGPWAEHDPP